MTDVFIVSDNIVSPLGNSSAENFSQLKNAATGLKLWDDSMISEQPFCASLFDKSGSFLADAKNFSYTKFERLLIASISDALKNSGIDSEMPVSMGMS